LVPLSLEEKTKIASALHEVHLKQDDVILKQGETGNTFHILFDGTVAIIKDDKEVSTLEACQSKETAQVFGEKALLSDEKRAATVKVISPSAKCFRIGRDDFDMLMGPLKDLLAGEDNKVDNKPKSKGKAKAKGKGSADSKGKAKADAPAKKEKEAARAKVLYSELEVLGLLGCGGFGAVELVEHKTTKDCWALKAISKGYILQTGMQDSITNEKLILTMTNSDFIVKLVETYNSPQNCYFLLELALGGELYATYHRKGLHGKEEHAKFYIAGTVYAFEHCHSRHVIYRDLKPENLLLTDEGRVKLTDMGLAKFVVGSTYTTCGTPDYFCPELIQSLGHTVAVDWWTLGILTFELLSGNPPFEAESPMVTYAKAMEGIEKRGFPEKCKGSVESLISGLLKKDPADRLPMLPGGIKNIQDHAWYEGFNWTAMQNGELEVPYKPTVKSKNDMKNFHARKEDMPPQIYYNDDGSGWDKDFATSI